jgi:hypothetical protein
MPLSSSDVIFTFSGGNANSNPDLSLGGDPSFYPIVTKRLFNNVPDAQTLSGVVDYRCIYLNNNSDTSSLYTMQILISYLTPADVSAQLGFNFENDRQDITVLNAVAITGGSFIITYTDVAGNHNLTINWDSSLPVWTGNLQAALRTITNLEDVVVNGTLSGSDVIFEIDFLGIAGNRYHDPIVLNANNLIAPEPVSIAIVKAVNGAPINSVATQIDSSTTTPTNVVFSSSPISLGDLRPLDSVPIWIRRIVPANSTAIENDTLSIRIVGEAVQA